MTKQQLEQLIDRYLQGNATEQEAELVQRFYVHLLEDNEVVRDWDVHDRNQIKNRMYRNIHGHIYKNQRKRIRYIVSAAAAVLLLLVSVYLYVNEFVPNDPIILPVVTTITTEAGSGQRSILLHDGTYVLLSPGSTISYPEVFDDQVRKVQLTGEAWFDVQRDTLHPFQVIANGVTTTVLGTSFSINAHQDNVNVEVRVTSGRVRVNSPEMELAVLEKDDQLIYRSGEVEVLRKEIDAKKEKLPEPGAFRLANVTMEEAAIFLEKRWNQTIIFENPDIRMCPLYASFNADDTLEEVLMIVCGVSNSKYNIENGKIRIYGSGCNQK